MANKIKKCETCSKNTSKLSFSDKLTENGNLSLILGAALGLNGLAGPCPPCIIGSAVLIVNGIREKVGIKIGKHF